MELMLQEYLEKAVRSNELDMYTAKLETALRSEQVLFGVFFSLTANILCCC